MPSTYYVAWWNLENLFDEENSPRRTDKLQRAIGHDLAGWTPHLHDLACGVSSHHDVKEDFGGRRLEYSPCSTSRTTRRL